MVSVSIGLQIAPLLRLNLVLVRLPACIMLLLIPDSARRCWKMSVRNELSLIKEKENANVNKNGKMKEK